MAQLMSALEDFIMRLFYLMLLGFQLLIIACGSDSNNPPQQQQATQGSYQVDLRPLNSSVAGNVTGHFTIEIDNDDLFMVEGKVEGASAGVRHLQVLHTNGPCPEASADTNADGIIDVQEGMRSYGAMLIPLDSDLNSQIDGSNYGPLSNSSGRYRYQQSASLRRMLADLRDDDQDTSDAVIKLSTREELNLEGRTVVIYGISARQNLPESVASMGTLSAYEILPVACGVIERTEDIQVNEGSPSGIEAYRIEEEQGINYGT
jgi:hypothetical protein